MPGKLILAATPIGNLSDITTRLENAIRSADVVFAEDTRHSQKLLNHMGIKRRLLSFHEHSKASRLDRVANALHQEKTVLYLSDAGTPGISDPGFELVRLAYEIGAQVDMLPGPCAVITALVLSGLPTDRFVFMGFFPRKQKPRQALMETLVQIQMTSVHFESPQRILDTLDFLEENAPDVPLALCREMTKVHQETLRGTPKQVREALTSIKGEMVLVVGTVTKTLAPSDLHQAFHQLISSGVTRTQAIKTVSKNFGISKREVQKNLTSAQDESLEKETTP